MGRRPERECPECKGIVYHYMEKLPGFPKIDEVRCLVCGWRKESKRKTDKNIPTISEIKDTWG